jgi:pimeloyl-ACP methyl ester carboxylesterase
MSTTLDAGRLAVPGAELHYEVRGSGPLVLVIGQPMTAEPFTPLADLLAADHTVVTYDPHGLGRSTVEDPSLPVTPEVQADDVALLIGHLGGGPADVVASSGGAVTGLALAARHPQLVRTLVAHEPPVCDLLPDGEHVRGVTDAIVEAFEQHGSGAAWGMFVSLVMYDGELTGPSVPPATPGRRQSRGATAVSLRSRPSRRPSSRPTTRCSSGACSSPSPATRPSSTPCAPGARTSSSGWVRPRSTASPSGPPAPSPTALGWSRPSSRATTVVS